MFLVNRLFGLNGPSPASELMTIDGGRLFLVRPDSIKGSRECIFIDASIAIRRTTHEFNYQLVVTRTFQDGEEQLLEEDAENSDERAFLLDSSLFLSLGPTLDPSATEPLPLSFAWLDPDGDGPDDEFEFILSQNDSTGGASELPAGFERLAWRCMWERSEKRSWPADQDEAKSVEAVLEDQFKVERAAVEELATQEPRSTTVPAKKVPLFRPPSPSSSDDEADVKPTRSALAAAASNDLDASDSDSDDALAAQLVGKLSLSSSPKPSSPKDKGKGKAKAVEPSPLPIAPPMVKPPTNAVPASATNSAAMVQTTGTLFLYDPAIGMFVAQEKDVEVGLHRTLDGFWLFVQGATELWVSQGLDPDRPVACDKDNSSIIFNFESDEGGIPFTWLIRFPDGHSFSLFQAAVTEAMHEMKWGRGSWKKLKEDEKSYMRAAYEDDEMRDIVEDDEQEDAVEEEQEDSEDDGDESEDEQTAFSPKAHRAKNSQLAVGYKDDMSFVVQGDMIGVFKQQREYGSKLKFVTSIVNIAGPDGKKNFTPDKVMLHNQDTSMILKNADAPGSLFRLDLETGKVVDEYKVSTDFDVKSFLPDSKFAQTTQQQTFIGLSHNGVFRIDPRLAGSKLVDSEFKQYATKNDFSVASTTESGRLAVASNKGDIRLFDKLGKNAKTALPALGDAIIGLDVSADGRWVLATCKTYLLLVDTLIPEDAGRYGGSSGFDRSFPANAKPTPKRLQLKPEHIAHMEAESKAGISFKPAHFNTALGSMEKTIVTATGPFLIAWNFRQVKAGKVDQYVLRRFSDTVVADNFQFGGDRKIVTLPGNVVLEDKKKLKAATRDSISHIVKTWEG